MQRGIGEKGVERCGGQLFHSCAEDEEPPPGHRTLQDEAIKSSFSFRRLGRKNPPDLRLAPFTLLEGHRGITRRHFDINDLSLDGMDRRNGGISRGQGDPGDKDSEEKNKEKETPG